MSDTTKTVSARILHDFRDDGTKKSFTAGDKTVSLDEGTFENYKAAGLVEAATETKTKPTA